MAEIVRCECTTRADLVTLIDATTKFSVAQSSTGVKKTSLKNLVLAKITSLKQFRECEPYLKISYAQGLSPRVCDGVMVDAYQNVKNCLVNKGDNAVALVKFCKTIQDQMKRFIKNLRAILTKKLENNMDFIPRNFSPLSVTFFISRGYDVRLAKAYSELPMKFTGSAAEITLLQAIEQFRRRNDGADEEVDTDEKNDGLLDQSLVNTERADDDDVETDEENKGSIDQFTIKTERADDVVHIGVENNGSIGQFIIKMEGVDKKNDDVQYQNQDEYSRVANSFQLHSSSQVQTKKRKLSTCDVTNVLHFDTRK